MRSKFSRRHFLAGMIASTVLAPMARQLPLPEMTPAPAATAPLPANPDASYVYHLLTKPKPKPKDEVYLYEQWWIDEDVDRRAVPFVSYEVTDGGPGYVSWKAQFVSKGVRFYPGDVRLLDRNGDMRNLQFALESKIVQAQPLARLRREIPIGV